MRKCVIPRKGEQRWRMLGPSCRYALSLSASHRCERAQKPELQWLVCCCPILKRRLQPPSVGGWLALCPCPCPCPCAATLDTGHWTPPADPARLAPRQGSRPSLLSPRLEIQAHTYLCSDPRPARCPKQLPLLPLPIPRHTRYKDIKAAVPRAQARPSDSR